MKFGALLGVVDFRALGEQLRRDFRDLSAKFGQLLSIGVCAARGNDVDALGDLLVNFSFEAVALFVGLTICLRLELAVLRDAAGRSATPFGARSTS